MAIEFHCTQCQKLLRTGDDTAGRQAKCPACGAVMTIPSAGAAPGDAAPPPPLPPSGGNPFGAGEWSSRPDESANPYQSPASVGVEPSGPQLPIAPTALDLGDIFSRTWAIFKQQWGMCLVALLVVWAISFGVNFIVSLGCNIVGIASKSEELAALLSFLGSVATQLFGIWLGIGQAKYFLKIARGQDAEIGELFTGGTHFIPILLASLLVGLIVFLGMLALIVPGIIFALMFSQFYYLVLDRNLAVVESLQGSKELMSGNKMTLFLIGVVSGLAFLVVVLLTCGLGILAGAPFLALLAPVIYLTITGQPTAEQTPFAPT